MTDYSPLGALIVVLALILVLGIAVQRRRAREEQERLKNSPWPLDHLTEDDRQDLFRQVIKAGKPMIMTIDENGKRTIKEIE